MAPAVLRSPFRPLQTVHFGAETENRFKRKIKNKIKKDQEQLPPGMARRYRGSMARPRSTDRARRKLS